MKTKLPGTVRYSHASFGFAKFLIKYLKLDLKAKKMVVFLYGRLFFLGIDRMSSDLNARTSKMSSTLQPHKSDTNTD